MIIREGKECAERITEIIGMPDLVDAIAVICSQYIMKYYTETNKEMREYYNNRIDALEKMLGTNKTEECCD
jgi:hypothetical protein